MKNIADIFENRCNAQLVINSEEATLAKIIVEACAKDNADFYQKQADKLMGGSLGPIKIAMGKHKEGKYEKLFRIFRCAVEISNEKENLDFLKRSSESAVMKIHEFDGDSDPVVIAVKDYVLACSHKIPFFSFLQYMEGKFGDRLEKLIEESHTIDDSAKSILKRIYYKNEYEFNRLLQCVSPKDGADLIRDITYRKFSISSIDYFFDRVYPVPYSTNDAAVMDYIVGKKGADIPSFELSREVLTALTLYVDLAGKEKD